MQDFVRLILRGCFKLLKVHIDMQISEDKLPKKAIYISNHISWLDPVILFAFLPKNPVFLLHSRLYRNKWLRFFMTFARKMEYNYIDAADAKKVMEGLHDGQYFVMFPEGMMSDSGDIMKIYEIPAIIADKTQSPLIPIWISGAQYSAFSETEGNMPHRPLPKIFVKVGKPEVIKAELVLLAMGFLKPEHPEYPENVFVCGDAANGASLVVRAIASGKQIADRVHAYLQK